MKLLKHCILSLLITGFVGAQSYYVQWGNTQAGLTIDGNALNPLLPNLGQQATAQLWAVGPDSVIDSTLFDDLTTDSDDVLLSSFTITNNGNSIAGTPESYGAFQTTSGFGGGISFVSAGVYMRVFQSTSIVPGTQYLVSGIFNVNSKDFSAPIAPTPDVINFPAGVFGLTDVVVAIPEPGTIGLIVFGGILGMVADRRRRARR